MKNKSEAIFSMLISLASLALPLSAQAITVGINVPASEEGMVFAPSPGGGVFVSRQVIQDGVFDDTVPTLNVRYSGTLLKNGIVPVSAYVSVNGHTGTVPMTCYAPVIDRGGDHGAPVCDLSLTETASPVLRGISPAVAWNLEFAFVTESGQWDSNYGANYRVSFPVAVESSVSSIKTGPVQISYEPNADSLMITYTPQSPGHPADIYNIGVLDEANAAPGGLYVGSINNGKRLPVAQLPLKTGQSYYGMALPDIFQGQLDLSSAHEGPMAIWYFDAKGNYDSRYGQNYTFNLRRR